MSDDEIWELRRGGLDPVKVYNAYHRAMQHNGQPTVILAKTVKGYGLGEAAEGRMTAHQQKKLGDADLLKIRDRFKLPLSDEAVTRRFYRPPEDSPEMRYMRQRVEAQGGPLPARVVKPIEIKAPALEMFKEALEGSRGREASTTSAFVSVMKSLLKSPELGKLVVPIIPDEARTFGMESLFREYGIYASQGQRYKPVDSNVLLYYKEAQNGQILEEGITEAGSMASCIAAGHGVRQLRRADDSVLHLLFDVRLPARGRSDLGLRRFARQGLPDGRHLGPHHACWARACSIRTATALCCSARCRPARFTIRPTPTSWR